MRTFSPLTATLLLDESLVTDFPSTLAFLRIRHVFLSLSGKFPPEIDLFADGGASYY